MVRRRIRRSSSSRISDFEVEKKFFHNNSVCVTSDTVFRRDSVARNEERYRIFITCVPGGAEGGGIVNLSGDLRVGSCFPVWNIADGVPYFELERRAVRSESEVE